MTVRAIMALSPWANKVKEFQQLGLINKAVLDATAVDIPLVTMAKNPTEQKERLLRQALVLLIAFVIAPIHARLLQGLVAKQFKLAPELFQLGFKQLSSTQQLGQALKILKTQAKGVARYTSNESLRQKLIKAKTLFMATDLAVCGGLLSSVGFIKVLFGQFLSGKKQFSGELGLTSEKTLDAIYAKEAENKKVSGRFKYAIALGLGVGAPVALSFLFRHSLLKAKPKASFLSKTASFMDYNYPHYYKRLKGWPMLSDGAMILQAALLSIGDMIAARSPREFKELAIQRNSIDAVFFFAAPVFMKLLSGSTTVQGAIDAVRNKSPKIIRQVGNRAANTYVLSYLLAGAAVAGITAYTNMLTKKGVAKAAQSIHTNPQSTLYY